MRFDLLTLFPEVISHFSALGVTGDAVRAGRLELVAWNPRDFAPKARPDDRPYGGGAGMVMQAEPLAQALQAARAAGGKRPVLLMSPQGERFDQSWAQQMAVGEGAILIAGRYEGIDERLIEAEVDAEISLGDFVLSGGELPALTIIDAVARLLPGVLGDADSAEDESFVDGTLEYPQYTRPDSWRGRRVPAVLLSGNHKEILHFRRVQSLGRTFAKRPDLLAECAPDAQTRELLRQYIDEYLAGLDKDAASD